MPMNIAQQALASLTGNVESAVVIVHDGRSTGGGLSSGNLSLKPPTREVLSKGSSHVYVAKDNDLTFRVQYNPSKLVLNATSRYVKKTDIQTKENRSIACEDPSLSLSVELFFDDMHIYDSFMWDALNTSAVSQVTALGAAAGKAIAGKSTEYSVKPQVEAFMAALRNPHTRFISFVWADFTFTGMLNTVSAEYTMFSTSGRPVRAKVALRLLHEVNNTYLESWYKDLETCFSGSSSNLSGAGSSVQNLINLGF